MWIEGWSSVVTVIFNRVEARESLVDRRLPNSPLYQCDYRRGSREPCGSKEPLFYKQKRGLPSRLARALWIEGHGNTIRNAGQWVEARESLVDRRKGRSAEPSLYARRGSREPCGSKAVFWATACQIGAVEARESLVDRRLIWMQFPLAGTSRGSREPCGSKSIRIAGLADR